ncbi:MAG: hypothetical protein QG608_2645 [Actinomycetota bacterium]|nr:hypothetical protein [Actinomycetota bacterium]
MTRRRGRQLDDALLEAAWEELISGSYAAFTVEAVAHRARTSRHVLYRRWPTRGALALAAIHQHDLRNARATPDTGSLRDDVIELLQHANDNRQRMAAIISMHVGTYYHETGTTPSDLREALLSHQAAHMDTIIRRATERGEIDPARVSPRIVSLPHDLFRHEVIMTLRPVPSSTIIEIVNEVFLPLITGRLPVAKPPA